MQNREPAGAKAVDYCAYQLERGEEVADAEAQGGHPWVGCNGLSVGKALMICKALSMLLLEYPHVFERMAGSTVSVWCAARLRLFQPGHESNIGYSSSRRVLDANTIVYG